MGSNANKTNHGQLQFQELSARPPEPSSLSLSASISGDQADPGRDSSTTARGRWSSGTGSTVKRSGATWRMKERGTRLSRSVSARTDRLSSEVKGTSVMSDYRPPSVTVRANPPRAAAVVRLRSPAMLTVLLRARQTKVLGVAARSIETTVVNLHPVRNRLRRMQFKGDSMGAILPTIDDELAVSRTGPPRHPRPAGTRAGATVDLGQEFGLP